MTHEKLFPKVLASLVVYHDGPVAYLRFVPLDMVPFRHGLSLNLKVEGNIEIAKRNVAEWLTSAIMSLITEP